VAAATGAGASITAASASETAVELENHQRSLSVHTNFELSFAAPQSTPVKSDELLASSKMEKQLNNITKLLTDFIAQQSRACSSTGTICMCS
jgi:hypothetical protein